MDRPGIPIKTAAGQAEMSSRQRRISQRHRTMLLLVDGKRIQISAERDPSKLKHKQNGIDFAVEATGIFTSREQCAMHIQAGAKRVLLTVPPKDAIDNMIVLGVNQETLKAEHKIISNASCTTNCLAPVAKVLQDSFGLVHGLMTTTHAYTNDQRILDLPHSDLRRARAAATAAIDGHPAATSDPKPVCRRTMRSMIGSAASSIPDSWVRLASHTDKANWTRAAVRGSATNGSKLTAVVSAAHE